MAIIIKEMRVRTIVEKKILTETDISENSCQKIRDRVLEKLLASFSQHTELRRKKER